MWGDIYIYIYIYIYISAVKLNTLTQIHFNALILLTHDQRSAYFLFDPWPTPNGDVQCYQLCNIADSFSDFFP